MVTLVNDYAHTYLGIEFFLLRKNRNKSGFKVHLTYERIKKCINNSSIIKKTWKIRYVPYAIYSIEGKLTTFLNKYEFACIFKIFSNMNNF